MSVRAAAVMVVGLVGGSGAESPLYADAARWAYGAKDALAALAAAEVVERFGSRLPDVPLRALHDELGVMLSECVAAGVDCVAVRDAVRVVEVQQHHWRR